LAAQLRAAVLDKDLLRAAVFAEPWIEYSREQDDFCIELLLQAGGYLVARPAPPDYLFVDGRTFARQYQIDRVAEFASGLGCFVKLIYLVCSDGTARHRLATDHVARNRDYALYLKVKASFEPLNRGHLTLNTDGGLTHSLMQQSLKYLRGD
jgi:hypothetical protein